MVNIIISLVSFILCFLVGFLPPFTCWIGLIVIYIISLGIVIYNCIYLISKEFKDLKTIIALVLSLLPIIYGYDLMNFNHTYNETRKGLNKEFSNYKIIGVEKDIKIPGCDYLFKVKLNDSTDIVFHASYCSFPGTDIPYYDATNDYISYYLPYYLNKYNKENNTNIKAYVKDEDKADNYNKDNYINVYNFVKFLFNLNKNAKYQLIFYNEDTKKDNIVNSWNWENRLNFLLENRYYHNYR